MADRDRQAVTVAAPPPRRPAPAPPVAGMAADGAPPFVLPGEHFAAALAWLALGAAGLVAVAPLLAAGAFTAPRVVAVAHCFTLGWLTTSIFGALYQLFPVVLGVSARSVRVGHVTFGLLQAGTASLVAGFWWFSPVLLAVGWTLLFAAVGGLAWNILPQRRRAPRGRLIGLYISGAHLGLGLAMLVAAARVGSLLGWWTVNPNRLLAAHVHLAALGFATLTAIGVGSRLLPMFLLSHGQADWPLRWIGPLVGAGLVAFGAGELGAGAGLALGGAAAMAAGVALYLYQAWLYYRHRVRRKLDPGLALTAVSHGFLLVSLAAGAALALAPAPPPHLAAAYGVLGILGWLTLFVAGIYQKILPFLTWLHRFGPRVGQPGLPTVADLVVPRWGWASLVLLASGTVVLAAAVGAGRESAARAGAALFAAGAAFLVAQGVRLRTVR